ncbi:hypothetical protein [uncultured Sphingomonas sp.]|uniref:hypothetical protein n=1 Tax=uncultured Sphingomonas sp. TaxID=158754 RepID=UPI002609717D|nr:hypothetical protein [uncultured Sphingomonas sp.]
MKTAIAIILAGFLAACSHEPDNIVANEAVAAANLQDTAALVAKLPAGQQRGVFMRAIRDAGLPCQDVTDFTRFPDEHGRSIWRAECSNGSQHLIAIGKGGMASVTSRPSS